MSTVRRDAGPGFVKQPGGKILGTPAHVANFFLNRAKPEARNSVRTATIKDPVKKFTAQVQFLTLIQLYHAD